MTEPAYIPKSTPREKKTARKTGTARNAEYSDEEEKTDPMFAKRMGKRIEKLLTGGKRQRRASEESSEEDYVAEQESSSEEESSQEESLDQEGDIKVVPRGKNANEEKDGESSDSDSSSSGPDIIAERPIDLTDFKIKSTLDLPRRNKAIDLSAQEFDAVEYLAATAVKKNDRVAPKDSVKEIVTTPVIAAEYVWHESSPSVIQVDFAAAA